MSTVSSIVESYRKCINHPRFFDHFYANLFARSPSLKTFFEKVDFHSQKTLIRKGVTTLLMYHSGVDSAREVLLRLTQTHGTGGMNITAPMYATWIEAMIATIREIDPSLTPELEQEWRAVLKNGIDFLIENSAPAR